jgi:hypothetical protein
LNSPSTSLSKTDISLPLPRELPLAELLSAWLWLRVVNWGCPRYDPCFELLFIERISLSFAASLLLITSVSLYSYLIFYCSAAISLSFYSFIRSPVYVFRSEEDGFSVLSFFTFDYSWSVLIFY